MAFPSPSPRVCSITANVFDGTRQPIPATTEVLYTLIDGNQKIVLRDDARTSSLSVEVPFHDNFGDSYAVIASAKGYQQAGFHPVKAAPNAPQQVDLMLLPKDASFNFSGAQYADIQRKRPVLARVLSADAESPEAARERYRDLLENQGATLACLLNIATALDQIHLPSGKPLDYFKHLIWDDSMKPDRFFAFADAQLVDQTSLAARQGVFAPDPGSAIFHPGATKSFKQIQFGEANVQLTFHENDRQTIDGVDCVMVEPDIDYFKDLAAHALLEVITNGLTGSITDPRQVYVLRWIAGRHAGVPEFDPLYTIA
jgi:hypothetical protein